MSPIRPTYNLSHGENEQGGWYCPKEDAENGDFSHTIYLPPGVDFPTKDGKEIEWIAVPEPRNSRYFSNKM